MLYRIWLPSNTATPLAQFGRNQRMVECCMVFAPLRLESYILVYGERTDGRDTVTGIDIGNNTSPVTCWGMNVAYKRRILLGLQRRVQHLVVMLY